MNKILQIALKKCMRITRNQLVAHLTPSEYLAICEHFKIQADNESKHNMMIECHKVGASCPICVYFNVKREIGEEFPKSLYYH